MDATLGEMAATIVLWSWFIGWALALARIDIREHRLPNRMVAVCFAGCVIATLVHAIVVADVTALMTPAVASVAAALGWGMSSAPSSPAGCGERSAGAQWGGGMSSLSSSRVSWWLVDGFCAGGGASVPSRSDPSWASV
ncbi:MAG: hypothetical protein GY871_14405 [Actinomycetales bacterium]|nr:hypothetical protein [Actinomycetales bacterium]MCP4892511.1 hypothetical protein [Actinomycetales bacterium]